MRILPLITLLFLSFGFASGQAEVLSLDSCLRVSVANHPASQQFRLLNEKHEAEKSSLSIAYLPSVSVHAQASWQNEVTNIDIAVPFLPQPLVDISKDQYRVFFDVKQSIWDGGFSRNAKIMEDAMFSADMAGVENELFRFVKQVSEVYFVCLKLQKQEELLVVKKWQLQSKLDDLQSAQNHGFVLQDAVDRLESEILGVEQKIIEVHYEAIAVRKMLGTWMHAEIDEFVQLSIPSADIVPKEQAVSYETMQLKALQQSLKSRELLLATNRYPKIYAFSQAGYGRPALNMLSNEFEPYVVVGAKLVWTPYDWGKTKNDMQSLKIQQRIFDTRISQVEHQRNALLEAQWQRIEKTRKLLQKDEEIVALKQKIMLSAEARLREGVLTLTDYLNAVNDELAARLNFEMHLIEQAEAVLVYNLLQGKTY